MLGKVCENRCESIYCFQTDLSLFAVFVCKHLFVKFRTRFTSVIARNIIVFSIDKNDAKSNVFSLPEQIAHFVAMRSTISIEIV